MRHSGRNVFGQAYSLTVLTPVLPERLNALAGHLDALPGAGQSPLARVPGTHFARWVVIDDVIYQGPPQPRDALAAPRLLFTSNFDGPLEPYLEALRTELGVEADAIWSHCTGYPGRGEPGPWAEWLRAHQVDSALFFSAYGDQTVSEVRENLELRSRLMRLALEAQGLTPAKLQSRFKEDFPT
ncbi:MAG: hypothetical protein ACR2ML_11845 [Solirubrobacteraceae bacterium]